jgi:hypothetical protein
MLAKKELRGSLYYYITPIILNCLCYTLILPLISPEIFKEYFICILFIFGGNMMCFTWKYIVSITMKFEFNSYSVPGLVPLLFTLGTIVIHYSERTEYLNSLIVLSLTIIWAYNIWFVPMTIM